MKQLLILSGKGGTGKTTVSSGFIKLMNCKAFADCDVDAPNLHLVTKINASPSKDKYFGLDKAWIDEELCVNCGVCAENCRFDAIIKKDRYWVNKLACEGCGVCEYVCPANAISMKKNAAGEIYLYNYEDTFFSTAQLEMGNGTTGMLVSRVKKQLNDVATDEQLAIIDGSPGIGCPVIASISGADAVVVVAEPSISGINDMERIIATAKGFGVIIMVCVNKYDTNIENTERIISYCKDNDISFVGTIPFDSEAVKSINMGESIVERDCISGNALRKIFDNTMKIINKQSSNL